MKQQPVDTSKLLGFDLKGEPLFDIVLSSSQEVSAARVVGAPKIGDTKVTASRKRPNGAAPYGQVKG